VSVFGLDAISHESRVLSIASITCMKPEQENEAEQGGAPNAHPRHASRLSLRSGTSRATGERG